MNIEIWKPVVGYEGLYEVSNKGRVRSLDRFDNLGRRRNGRILKANRQKRGYMACRLCDYRGQPTKKIHRIVAEAFIPNCENKKQINHKDGNKSNNVIENLEWATNAENVLHAYRTGLQPKREKCGRDKIPVVQIDFNNNQSIAVFGSIAEAARSVSRSDRSLYAALRGKTKQCGGYRWEVFNA